MLEKGKCYYNDRLIVKIINNRTNHYIVKGINISNRLYYHQALMRQDTQLIPLDDYKFDKIFDELQSSRGRFTPEILDLINELIFEI